MNKKNSVALGIFSFLIVLFAGLFVNGMLGLSGFDEIYRNALMSRYSIQGEVITNKIESSLNLGKKLYLLDNQVKPLFNKTMADIPEIEHLYITDNSEKIIYTTRSVLKQDHIPFKYYEGKSPSMDNLYYTYKFLDSWFACLPFYSAEGGFEGTLYIEISQNTISEFTGVYFSEAIKFGIIVFICGFLAYVIFSVFFIKTKRAESVLTILIMLGTLLPFSFYSYKTFNKALTKVFNTNMVVLSQSISSSLDSTGHFVEGFVSVSGMDEYLETRLKGNEHCASISITNGNYAQLYSASIDGQPVEIDVDNPDFLVMPFKFGEGEQYLVLQINRALINEILRDMAVDSAVIIVVALIFAFILKDLFMLISRRRDLLVRPEKMSNEEAGTALKLIKISTFIFMFAAFETVSFIPLYIQDVYSKSAESLGILSAIPADTVISLPVGSYMFGIMVSMFITLFVIKKLAVKYRYVLMSLVFVAGSFLTMWSDNMLMLIIARLVAGFGFGGILLSTSSLVIAYTSSKSRSAGFGTNAAGFAAASIASIPVGGVLVSKFGYDAGLMTSIVFAILFLLFSLTCVPNPNSKKNKTEETDDIVLEEPITGKQFFKVLGAPSIWAYIICINIPFQLIYWGLFQFLLPIYMNDTLHLSQSNIGLILSIFSFISLGAAIAGRMADKMKNDKFLIGIGALLAGASLVIFGFMEESILFFVVVMVFMGIDNLFIDSIEEVYLASCPIKDVSEENVLQSYKVIEKVLSVFIPTVTGLIISFLGFNVSLMSIGAYSLLGALLFFVLGRNYRWRKNHEIKK